MQRARRLCAADACNRIAQCVKYRNRQHQRRLAHRLGMKHGVLGVWRVLQQADAGVLRPVAHRRDFVGRRRVGGEHAAGIPAQFFAGQPARALGKAAFDLAEVERRVNRAADVVQDVEAHDTVLAGQRVYGDFGHGRAVGEVEERSTTEGLAVIVNLRRAVVAGGRQRDPCHVGFQHERGERHGLFAKAHHPRLEHHAVGADLILQCGVVGEPLLDGARRRLRCLAVEVAAGRRRRGRGIRHLAGVGGADANPVERNAEFVRHHLRDLGEQALAHFGAAVVEQHAAVGVDVQQRPGLVELRGGE